MVSGKGKWLALVRLRLGLRLGLRFGLGLGLGLRLGRYLDDVLEVALEHPVQLKGLSGGGAQVAVAPPGSSETYIRVVVGRVGRRWELVGWLLLVSRVVSRVVTAATAATAAAATTTTTLISLVGDIVELGVQRAGDLAARNLARE